MVWTRAEMDAMSVMLPRMLEVWVQATSFVDGVSKEERVAVSRWGFVHGVCEGVHHFMVSCRQEASCSQDATFASWSSFERMISEPGVRCSYSARERLRKSWVVEGPRTLLQTKSASFFQSMS